MKLPNKAEPSPDIWWCPLKEQQIFAVCCGQDQELNRRACENHDCPNLDYTRATVAWEDYKRRKKL